MKKKIVGVIVLILLISIIGIIWYKSPVNFMALDPSDVAEITIFDRTSGEAVNISGKEEIEQIISNLNSVRVERGILSQGKKGYRFRFTIHLEEYAETVGWTSFIINSNDTIRRDPFFYNVINGNVDLEYIQNLFDEASEDMNTQVASPEETFVLTDSGKEFLQRMCLYVPEFDSEVDMDTQFWRDFMFYSFTGMFDESVEQVNVYREGLGFEEPQAKVSLEQMEGYAKLTFGVALPDLKPKIEELSEKETAFYFEDGFYYIGCSDFPNYSFTYKDCTVVDEPEETSISVDYDITFEGEENYGTVTFTLSPEDNENGFIILSKKMTLKLNDEFSEVEQSQENSYALEEYGKLETVRQEFTDEESGELSFYYELEKFYAGDNVTNASSVNGILQSIYDEYEKQYLEDAEIYKDETDRINMPYDYLHFLNVEYVGDDYISIQYNDVNHMGGAHAYSCFDGITINLESGEEVFASHFIEKSDEEILEEISNAMGLDTIGTWDDIDFYITDSKIVFFNRMPNYWDDVVLDRKGE